MVAAFPKNRSAISFNPPVALARIVPKLAPGWTVCDLPLGATELEAGETKQALNCSSYFYKLYKCGHLELRVYAAYWLPGKMDPSLVIAHRPDSCWVANGATCIKETALYTLSAANSEESEPGLFGIFDFSTGQEEVVFWHRSGMKVSDVPIVDRDYGETYWRHHLQQVLNSLSYSLEPKEQLVFRLSTNETMHDVVESAFWPSLRSSLAEAGFWRSGTSRR